VSSSSAATPHPSDAQADRTDRVLPIVGFVLAIVVAPAGVVVSAVALVLARRHGVTSRLAVAGVAVGVVLTSAALIATVVGVVLVVVWTVAGIMCGESGQACELAGP
jgi:ABC-type cobalamin transport system permease subunit